jgi:hypothetical protein
MIQLEALQSEQEIPVVCVRATPRREPTQKIPPPGRLEQKAPRRLSATRNPGHVAVMGASTRALSQRLIRA